MLAAVYNTASFCGDMYLLSDGEPDTRRRMRKRTTMGPVAVPKRVDQVQVGAKGAANTPTVDIRAEKIMMKTHIRDVITLFVSTSLIVETPLCCSLAL